MHAQNQTIEYHGGGVARLEFRRSVLLSGTSAAKGGKLQVGGVSSPLTCQLELQSALASALWSPLDLAESIRSSWPEMLVIVTS